MTLNLIRATMRLAGVFLMSNSLTVAPIRLDLEDDAVRINIVNPETGVLEVPPAFEEQLRQAVEGHGEQLKDKALLLELGNMPAMSSRQLGMILTIREVMLPFGRLQLQNVSTSVKQLIHITGTDRLFDL